MNPIKKTFSYGAHQVTLETGEIARQAHGAVVCTMEEYYATVRVALQRYAMAQAAQGNPEVVARITGEITRLDTAQAAGQWPGAYRSRWERLLVWVGRRYATRFLGRRYYRRARAVAHRRQQDPGLVRARYTSRGARVGRPCVRERHDGLSAAARRRPLRRVASSAAAVRCNRRSDPRHRHRARDLAEQVFCRRREYGFGKLF